VTNEKTTKDQQQDSLESTLSEVEPSPVEASPELVETLQKEIDKLKDQWLRAVAETENIRRRAQKDREDANKYAITQFAREMLNVSDNLQRALENCPRQEDLPESVKSLISGIEMTEKELHATLERQGVKSIHPLNEKFDPNLHQAMFEVENLEVEQGTIVQVLQRGYTLHDRLLRPALVAVAKGIPEQIGKTTVIS
jgi:molecular chaperone GrpE